MASLGSNELIAGPVYTRYPNLVIIVPADALSKQWGGFFMVAPHNVKVYIAPLHAFFQGEVGAFHWRNRMSNDCRHIFFKATCQVSPLRVPIAIYIYIHTHFVIKVHANALAPNGVRSSAGILMTIKFDIFSLKFLCAFMIVVDFLGQMTLFIHNGHLAKPRITLRWRHNERDSVSNHQPHDYLLNRLFRRRLKKSSKLRVTGLCVGNSPGTGEFPAQMASYAENVSIWWRHHDMANPVINNLKDRCIRSIHKFT